MLMLFTLFTLYTHYTILYMPLTLYTLYYNTTLYFTHIQFPVVYSPPDRIMLRLQIRCVYNIYASKHTLCRLLYMLFYGINNIPYYCSTCVLLCSRLYLYTHTYIIPYTCTGKETQAIHENVYCEIHIYVTSCEKQPVPVPALYRTMRPLAHEAKNKGIFCFCSITLYTYIQIPFIRTNYMKRS